MSLLTGLHLVVKWLASWGPSPRGARPVPLFCFRSYLVRRNDNVRRLPVSQESFDYFVSLEVDGLSEDICDQSVRSDPVAFLGDVRKGVFDSESFEVRIARLIRIVLLGPSAKYATIKERRTSFLARMRRLLRMCFGKNCTSLAPIISV